MRNIAPKKINEDVVVPVSNIPVLIRGLEQLSNKFEIPIVNFGHAGNGNIHVNLLFNPDDKTQNNNAHQCLDGDKDVDTADRNTQITNWTGAMMGPAGNLEDGDNANLIYDPATGNVTLDAGDTASGVLISFVLGTSENNMLPENLTESAPGNAGPFVDVGTNTDATTFQIGQTDPLNQGAGPLIELGQIMPPGMDVDQLSE